MTAKLKEVEDTQFLEECRREDLQCILKINVLPKKDSAELIIDGSPLKPFEIRRLFKVEQIWQQSRDIFAGYTHGSVIDLSNAVYYIDGPEVLFASTLFSGPLGFAKPRSNNSIKILEVLNQNLSSLAASSLKSKHFYFKILLARLASEVRGRCLRLLHIEWRLGPSPGTLPQY